MPSMTPLFSDVDGCHLEVPTLHLKVPFPSSSDALFASLFLKYTDIFGIGVADIFNDLLQLFRKEEFCLQDISLQRSFDVTDRIGEERRQIAATRATRITQDVHYQPPVPTLIVEFVADLLEEEDLSYSDATYKNLWVCKIQSTEQRTLQAMTLVHRTWTNIVQTRLRRRVNVSGIVDLQPALESPCLGPWVHELALVDTFEGFQKEHLSSIAMVLEKCSNLRCLVLQSDDLFDEDRDERCTGLLVTNEALLRMGKLTFLKAVIVGGVCVKDMWQFCSALSNLHALEKLQINLVSTGKQFAEVPHPSVAPKASPKLETLILTAEDEVDPGPFIWLISQVKHLEMDPTAAESLVEYSEHVAENVTKVYFSSSAQGRAMWKPFFDRFPSIQSLGVVFRRAERFILPNTVQSFHLHTTSVLRPLARARLCSIVDASTNLRNMLITRLKSYRGDDRDYDPSILDELRKTCAEKGVEFQYRIISHTPCLFYGY